MLEEEEVEVPVSSISEPLKDEAPNQPSPVESDVNMKDVKSMPDVSSAGIENKAPDTEEKSEDKPVQMETDAKVCYTSPDLRFSFIFKS